MRIEVTRTGGFTGIGRHVVLDTTSRPDGPRLEALAREITAEGANPDARGVPDGFHYEITFDDQAVRCMDPHITPAQRELLQTVLGEGA